MLIGCVDKVGCVSGKASEKGENEASGNDW